MSHFKHEMEMQEGREDVAIEILVDAGVLERCPLHGNLLDNYGDIVEAYKFAAARFRDQHKNYDYAMDQFGSQTHLTDTIKAVYEDNPYPIECPRCEYLDRE